MPDRNGAARIRHRRKSAELRGRLAEFLVAFWLLFKGYRRIAQRVRTPVGEIDLIVRRGRMLVFVEVKARQRSVDAAYSLTVQQQGRIMRAATWWLAKRPQFAQDTVRFDAVLVSRFAITHIIGAFDTSSLSA